MLEINKIYNDDCFNLFDKIEDSSIDLILTDPPYNVSQKESIDRSSGKFKAKKDISLNFGEWGFNSVIPTNYIDIFVNKLKDCGVLCIFYDKLYLGQIGCYLQEKYDFQVRHIGAWVKSNPAPQARKVKWQNGTEMFLLATKNKKSGHHFNFQEGQSPDYFKHSVSYKHEHPTQKPLPLFEWIIKFWSFEKDIILDPFAGSCTTALACKKLNRNYICIEKEKKYSEIGEKRILEYDESYGLLNYFYDKEEL